MAKKRTGTTDIGAAAEIEQRVNVALNKASSKTYKPLINMTLIE